MTSHWIDELNPAQSRAVTHQGGPVLVIAGAGTGKTKTLASRVAWLVEQGTAPESILLLTFTRRAAAEMLDRAGSIAGAAAAGQVWGGTFHATANRLLRLYGRAIGLSPDFTVLDQSDAGDVMDLVRSDLALDRGKRRFPRKATLVSIYSRTVNSREKLSEVLSRHYPWCQDDREVLAELFKLYTARKRDRYLLDYDDLLLYWKALCDADGIGQTVADLFEHVLVDEYQDTNLIQAEILQGMRRRHRNIMVVGDDAQSIYSFRAATVRNILDFPKTFEGTEIVTLEQNYRSVQPILDASNAVMSQARERFTKNLFSRRESDERPELITCLDESEQSHEVCDLILARLEEGVDLMQQAVLFRAGHHSDHLEVELTRRNIPFVKYGGLKFMEAAHIKDLLACLRILENPWDEISWFRVLKLLEGVGPKTAARILDTLGLRGEAPDPDRGEAASPLAQFLATTPPAPESARQELERLQEAFSHCVAKGVSPGTQVERLRAFYEPHLPRLYENAPARSRDLDQLELVASRYHSLRELVTDLTLDPPASTQDLAGPAHLDEDYLILSTIHSAKGCEWDTVHIIHAADGMIPSDMATGNEEEIEEERRLLYVAMTRAKNRLRVFFPLRYYHRGRGFSDRHSYAQQSRFLDETALPFFLRRTATSARSRQEAKIVAPTEPVRIDLDHLFEE